MIVLPRGSSVKEGVNPARVNLPEAMERLAANGFSGYLRFDSAKGTGIIIFRQGHLISALICSFDQEEKVIAYDAIVRIFEMSLFEKTVLNIYRVTPEAALHIHAVLQGDVVEQGQELATLDVPELLRHICQERRDCCLRIYADDQAALILYADGQALGFFHDGSSSLESKADLGASVARLPGARLDVLAIRFVEGKRMADLMMSADLAPLWEKVRNRLLAERQRQAPAAQAADPQHLVERRQRILTLLRGVAERHVGKFGVSQVDKSFKSVSTQLTDSEMTQFYAEVSRLTKLAAGPSKLRKMIDEMRQRVAAFL